MAWPSIGRLAGVCKNISLALAGCLPFLVPFDAFRNIELQGLVLIICGGFAWAALLFDNRAIFKRLGRLSQVCLAVFATACIISLLVNPHFGYDLLGAPYIRLGTAGLLACIGIGLLMKTVHYEKLVVWLYGIIVGLSVLSVPYSLWRFHSLARIGGVFAQADIFACFVGCGFLLGLEMLSLYPSRQKRSLLIGVQLFWAGLLVLTQTRAVLLLLIVLCTVWGLRKQQGNKLKPALLYTVAALILLTGFHYFTPNRLTNTAYASSSIRYRLTLQSYALHASKRKVLLGYGPGNLADALACSRLPAGQLQTTCGKGYFFNSSHNIFIDRILAVGWLGGLSYLALVIVAIYAGLRHNAKQRTIVYALLLIAGYYLTNVTNVPLELLTWILLIQCLIASPRNKKRA
jgi:O-antigen ligase